MQSLSTNLPGYFQRREFILFCVVLIRDTFHVVYIIQLTKDVNHYEKISCYFNTSLLRTKRLGLQPVPDKCSAKGQSISGALGYSDVSNAGAFINPNLPSDIVDWVLVELRHPSDPSTVTTAQAFLLRNDGQVVNLDGSDETLFFNVVPDRYHVAIHHRNHLGVQTAGAPILIPPQPNYLPEVDFTDLSLATYGNNAQKITALGKNAMIACDANGDGSVDGDDRIQITSDLGLAGYLGSDCNLNGQVQNTDLQEFFYGNSGHYQQVP